MQAHELEIITLKESIKKAKTQKDILELFNQSEKQLVLLSKFKPPKDEKLTRQKKSAMDELENIKRSLVQLSKKTPVNDETEFKCVYQLVSKPMSEQDSISLAHHILKECDKRDEIMKASREKVINRLKIFFDAPDEKKVYEYLNTYASNLRRSSIPNVKHHPPGSMLFASHEAVQKDLLIGRILFNPAELSQYHLIISQGKFQKVMNDKYDEFSTEEMISHGKQYFASFVMNAEGRIYIFSHQDGENKVFHSSVSGIKDEKDTVIPFPVMAAGEISVLDGKLVGLTSHSGHYAPSSKNMYDFLKFLKRRGVDFTDAKIILFEKLPLKSVQEKSSEMYLYDMSEFYDHMQLEAQRYCKAAIDRIEEFITTNDWKTSLNAKKITLEDGNKITVPLSAYKQWQVIQNAKEKKELDWEKIYTDLQNLARDALVTPKPGLFGIGKRDDGTIKYLKLLSETAPHDLKTALSDLEPRTRGRKY